MDRATHILTLLSTGEQTSSSLACACDSPEASVRRTIQTLRRDGFNIAFAGAPTYVYRMER